MVIDEARLRSLGKAFKKLIRDGMKGIPIWQDDFMLDLPGKKMTAAYKMVVRKSRVTEWITDRRKQDLKAYMLNIALKNWDDSVEVDRNDILYEELGQIKAEIAALPEDKPAHKEELLLDYLENGHGAGAAYQTYDKVPLFSTVHPIETAIVAAGTQQNYWSDLDFTAANIQIVRAAMRALKGEDGKVLKIQPNHIWFTSDLEGTFENLIEKNPLAGGEGNVLHNKFKPICLRASGETNLWGMVDLSIKSAKPFGWAHAVETAPRWLVKPGEEHKEGLFGFDYDAWLFPIWWQLITKCVHTP